MTGLTQKQYEQQEKGQTIHRSINSLLSVLVLILGIYFVQAQVAPLYDRVTGIEQQRVVQSEIAQIVEDEGYRRCVYNDSRGLATVGFGHLMTKADNFKCIEPQYAVDLLRKDYRLATKDVEKRYPWAEGEVKLILINLSFNMGANRLAKFKETLRYLKLKQYDKAAGELLDSRYARQVPHRAARMAGRVMRLEQ